MLVLLDESQAVSELRLCPSSSRPCVKLTSLCCCRTGSRSHQISCKMHLLMYSNLCRVFLPSHQSPLWCKLLLDDHRSMISCVCQSILVVLPENRVFSESYQPPISMHPGVKLIRLFTERIVDSIKLVVE